MLFREWHFFLKKNFVSKKKCFTFAAVIFQIIK